MALVFNREEIIVQPTGSENERAESDLLARSLRGDRAAYGRIVEMYQARVFNLISRMTRDAVAAEDLTQETFVRAFCKIDRFDPHRRFAPWIMRIAANLTLNYLKAPARRERPADDKAFEAEMSPAPDAAYESHCLIEKVEQALKELPEKVRLPILLHHQEGLSFKEISQVLGVPAFVLKMRVSRGRKQLRALVSRSVGESALDPARAGEG